MEFNYSITSREEHALTLYLKDISKIAPIPVAEETRLATQIQEGDPQSLERLVCGNLRFVVSVSKRYQNLGLSLSDLINEGNIGLITAARKFDASQGFKFLSYAGWWIKQAILKALAEKANLIYLPGNQHEVLRKLKKSKVFLEQKLEREPVPEELSLHAGLAIDKVEEALAVASGHVSLFAKNSGDKELCLLDTYAAEVDSPDKVLELDSVKYEVRKFVSTLTAKESEVLKLYFGIGTPTAMTMEEISERICVSRERVRQIKEKAVLQLQQTYKSSSYCF